MRIQEIPRIRWLRASAMPSPRASPSGTDVSVKKSVLRSAVRNRGSLSSVAKLSRPTNFGGVSRSHLVRLIPRAAMIGPADRTASPIRVGARNSHAQRDSVASGLRPAAPDAVIGRRSLARPRMRVQLVLDLGDGLGGRLIRCVEDVRVELALERPS